MPNFTAADAAKHNKGLSPKKQRQWAHVANSVYDRCIKNSGKNCDAAAIKAANGVVEGREEDIDSLIGEIEAADPEYRQQIIEGLYHQYSPELFPTEVIETTVIEGVEVHFIDQEPFLHQVTECTIISADQESLETEVLEAKEKDKHLATFKAIQGRNEQQSFSGISLNGNFYSGKVAEALAPLLLNQRKMFLDHKLPERFGRPTIDLAGVINESWAKDGASYVKTDILTENPNTGWLWEVVKKYPNEVGCSISSLVGGRRAKIDGKDVFAVEEWKKVLSLDFVGQPSAGGVFVALEGEMANVEESEKQQSLADALKTAMARSGLNQIGWLVIDMIRSAALDKNADEETKRKNVRNLVKEFGTEIEKLDPVSLYADLRNRYMYYEAVETDLILVEALFEGDTVLSSKDIEFNPQELIAETAVTEVKFSDKDWSSVDKSKLPPSAFLIVGDPKKKSTWHLPYKDESGAVNKGALRAIAGVLGGARSKRTFTISKEARDKIVRLIKAAGISSKFAKSTPTKEATVDADELKGLSLEQVLVANPAVQAEKTRLEKALAEITEAKTEVDKKVTQLQEELDKTKKSLDEVQLKEAERSRVDMVNRLLGESKILDPKVEGHITDGFKSGLIKLATEGEEPVKNAIADRETLITSERQRRQPTVHANGQRPAPVPVAENQNAPQGPYNGVAVLESSDTDSLVANLRAR